ncbi:site-specific DNA-methyltransferase [Roseomonas sp. HJA6]|uniref:Methyltransferase n=1 Tax=Roseomonas alba TaxID=2846776 RepID=A0ABS7ACG7_9PROT|nr:DNA methyltransferase [Neoroseomonas alba]MBW6400004.1 site-specific DNA-methyltransferase [Neoroseomonas alba]
MAHPDRRGAAGMSAVPWKRREQIGLATLYLGDCREIVPTLQRPGAVISDPPYGQRQNTNVLGKGGLRAVTPPGCGARAIANVQRARRVAGGLNSTGIGVRHPEGIAGDDGPFDPAPWIVAADRVLLWGAHRFADRLPTGSWLIWDKVPTGKVRDQGDGEAAWINDDPPRPMRIFRLLWDGVCVGSAARHEVTSGQQRVHPTQKPEALIDWCFARLALISGESVLDPFMGAGSTGVIAVRRHHPFIGVEIEERYFDTACRRIEEAQRQGDLLRDVPA